MVEKLNQGLNIARIAEVNSKKTKPPFFGGFLLIYNHQEIYLNTRI